MGESKRHDVVTDQDWSLAETVNIGIDRLKKKSYPLRRVQAVQDKMFAKLEKQSEKRLKQEVKSLRPGRIFTEDYAVISQSAENAGWYEKGANTDSLTGLLTKKGLVDKLEGVRAEIRRETVKKIMVLQFDLNGFKDINDNYSHEHGDQAIKIFAQALSGIGRKKIDTAVRKQAGGDEFYLLLGLGKDDNDVEKIKEKVIARIFDKVTLLMQREQFEWNVLNQDGLPLKDKNGNPVYAATGIEVIDISNVNTTTNRKLFDSLEKQYKNEKKVMRVKKRV